MVFVKPNGINMEKHTIKIPSIKSFEIDCYIRHLVCQKFNMISIGDVYYINILYLTSYTTSHDIYLDNAVGNSVWELP